MCADFAVHDKYTEVNMFVIETSSQNIKVVNDLLLQHSDEIQILKSKSISLDNEIVQIVMTLSPMILTAISAVIIELIKSKKEFTLKNGDKEISLKGFNDKSFNDDTIQNILIDIMGETERS